MRQFFDWCEKKHFELTELRPASIAGYIEQHQGSSPTVKQHLAAIRMLFDWLVIGQIMPMNPAASVRGPKYVVKVGKTPVLTADEARQLLDSIDTATIVGLRDRALIGLMFYTFARVSAAVRYEVEDYFQNGKRGGSGCTKKAASVTRCPPTTTPKPTSTLISPPPASRDQKKLSPVPHHRPAPAAHRPPDRPHGCALRHDKAAGEGRGTPLFDLLPHFPGNRHHRLPRKRRHHRERPGHRRARIPANHQALRPDQRRDHA